jgi:hypothetical protein
VVSIGPVKECKANIQLNPVYCIAEVEEGPLTFDTVEAANIVEEVEFESELGDGVADELSVIEVSVFVPVVVEDGDALGGFVEVTEASVVGFVGPSRLCL